MLFDDSVRYLLSLGHETLALKLGLKTTEELLHALDDPQTAYPAVQIAGTNGKGSTAVFLDSICRAAAIKTGLFTSPHLVSITERIRIAGSEIPQSAFAELATTVRVRAEDLVRTDKLPAPPTFFEQVTAIALLAFKKSRVDLAILETGLGGRLDSTTVARAETVGITPIALDHQEYLGETLQEIAAEKAAIIRPGVTAVVGLQLPEALGVILEKCASAGVTPRMGRVEATDSSVTKDGRIRATFKSSQDSYEQLLLGLRGRHQVGNAAMAIELAESLRERGFKISSSAIREGLESARHPGRLELIEGEPAIMLDGAHNPAGALALRAYLDEFVSQPITIVFGAMRDKDVAAMSEILFPRATHLVLTQMNNVRSVELSTLEAVAEATHSHPKISSEPSVAAAIQHAAEVTPAEGLICVTGSLYLVGEARGILETLNWRLPEKDTKPQP